MDDLRSVAVRNPHGHEPFVIGDLHRSSQLFLLTMRDRSLNSGWPRSAGDLGALRRAVRSFGPGSDPEVLHALAHARTDSYHSDADPAVDRRARADGGLSQILKPIQKISQSRRIRCTAELLDLRPRHREPVKLGSADARQGAHKAVSKLDHQDLTVIRGGDKGT